MDEHSEAVRLAMIKLRYKDEYLKSHQTFVAAVEAVDLEEVTKANMTSAVYAALAIEAYRDDLVEYVAPAEAYLAAGTGIDAYMFENSLDNLADRSYFNKECPAEIIEVMLLKHGRAIGAVWADGKKHYLK